MNIDNYWMWITSLDLYSHKNLNILLNHFSSPEEVWEASSDLLHSIKGLPEKYIEKILNTKDINVIERNIKLLENKDIKYISIDNKEYPDKLKNIYDYPYGIYVRGKLNNFNKKYVAIVGSRKCSDYGADVTKIISRQLVENNVVVVSGMAKGIDSMAHIGAIEANIEQSTVAVFGCGIDVCYPKENEELMYKIIENGGIISEYPLGTSPHQTFFPKRNRIISGLSNVIIVVEATKKSGSLITADQALEQGRDVFAVPGNITSKLSEGTNDLIKQGAMLLSNCDDVLNCIGYEKNNCKESPKISLEKTPVNSNNEYFLAPDEKLVYDCISLEPQNIDTIFNKVSCPINKLQSLLSLMELKGYIQQLPGQRYVRSEL